MPLTYPLDSHTDQFGYVRPLGLVPPMACSQLPVGTFEVPVVPEQYWSEFDLTAMAGYPLVVKDQDGKGACNGHATAEAMELARWIHGQPYVALSGWFPYAIMCNGWDRGSSIGEALTLIQTGRIYNFPVILICSQYWKGFIYWFQETLVKQGAVSADDADLFYVTDEPKEMADIVCMVTDELGVNLKPASKGKVSSK
jgi:hypothetical protein